VTYNDIYYRFVRLNEDCGMSKDFAKARAKTQMKDYCNLQLEETKMKIHIWISDPESFANGEYESCFTTSMKDDWTIGGWVYAGQVELEIIPSREDVVDIACRTMTAKIQEIRATSEKAVEEIEVRKQNLLAITHEVEK
jgi:hypothetical protein